MKRAKRKQKSDSFTCLTCFFWEVENLYRIQCYNSENQCRHLYYHANLKFQYEFLVEIMRLGPICWKCVHKHQYYFKIFVSIKENKENFHVYRIVGKGRCNFTGWEKTMILCRKKQHIPWYSSSKPWTKAPQDPLLIRLTDSASTSSLGASSAHFFPLAHSPEVTDSQALSWAEHFFCKD